MQIVPTKHRRSQKLEYEGPKIEAKGRKRRYGSWKGGSDPAMSSGERCKIPQRGPGRSPGRKGILYTSLFSPSYLQDCRSGLQSLARTRTAYIGLLNYVADLPGRRPLCFASTNCLAVPPVKLTTVANRAFPVVGLRT